MKRLIVFSVTLSLFFGCKSPDIKSESLIGKWECISLNDRDLKDKGFTSIKMKFFSNDSLEVITTMKTFGDITTQSEGGWAIENKIFKSKLGEDSTISEVTFKGDNIVFTPDPLFNPELIKKSEYRRITK